MVLAKMIRNFKFDTLAQMKGTIGKENEISYCAETDTTYKYIEDGSAYVTNDTSVTITDDGGDTRRIAIYGRYTTLQTYGEFFAYGKSATLVFGIATASAPHVLHNITATPSEDIVAGSLSGFTLNVGRNVDADITNIKNGASGKLQIQCSAAHGLITGDIVSITKENRVSGNNIITTITYVDATNFICDDITYSSGTQTSTAVIDLPAYLLCGASAAGKYLVNVSLSTNATLAKDITYNLHKNNSIVRNIIMQSTGTGTVETISGSGIIDLISGDKVFLSATNASGVEDVIVNNCNLSLNRI